MTAPALVQKLWNYCNILRDDGLSYGDYVEQLTFLLFLKMADEQSRTPYNKPSPIPKGFGWDKLVALDGDDLEIHYRHTLEELGKRPGMLGIIFRKAQNKIQDPSKLRRLIADLIDKETWTSLDADLKGDAYEGLLEKNAADVKGGAGQYFTPRSLISAIVEVMAPQPGQTICDPACGTGGFLLAAFDHLSKLPNLDRSQKKALSNGTFHGIELVDSVTRLCAMNMLLHGIGGESDTTDLPVTTKDALAGKHGEYDLVLANPPFGKKSSVTIIGADGEQSKESLTINRDDFWATTSNKQLNFVQHVKSLLQIHGRAAVVVPDNVLFEGGAGETIRRRLLAECDVHTLLRLPTGIFYAQGVKANVLFFDRKPASAKPWTRKLWVYDLRTNHHFTLKTNPLKRADLDAFVALYKTDALNDRQPTWSDQTPEGRWRAYDYADLTARDKCSLDLFWLKDDSLLDADNLPEPHEIAAEIAEDLRVALEQIEEILGDLAAPG